MLKHLSLIVESILSMTGRVTMLSIARRTEKRRVTHCSTVFQRTASIGRITLVIDKSHLSETYAGTWGAHWG